MKYLKLLPLALLSGCLATLPVYENRVDDPSASISFNDVSNGWYPFGKSLAIELYDGCTNSRTPMNGVKENALGKLKIKEAEMGVKQYAIPADKQLYIWIGVPNGCGGPMALTAEEGAVYEAQLKSRNNVQCSINIYEIKNGERTVAKNSRSVRRKGFLNLGDETYSWRMCEHIGN